jgi:GTP-binding protein
MSNQDYTKCPEPNLPEYAFIGRSNVGKSSLINALTNKKGLAKTSAKPGKTQLINHFEVDQSWYLVDLPGYGYASVSKSQRAGFSTMIEQYLLNRPNLFCTFLLIDIRHAPQKADLKFMEFLGGSSIPFVMLFTKADKLSKQRQERAVEAYHEELSKVWEELPQHIVTSSVKKEGLDELLGYIHQLNEQYHEAK